MKQIQLTKGQVAQVDDEDYEYLSQWNWYARFCQSTKSFYAQRKSARLFGHKNIPMHRVIMNTPEEMEVDHINHDTLDNQRSNLRNCTKSQNHCNTIHKNSCGYRGIAPNGNSWQARITVDGKRIYLLTYPTREEAARAYDEAAKIYHGEFARLNFPNS